MGLPSHQIETSGQHWDLIRSYGEPPPLTPALFLSNRDEACARVKEVLRDTTVQLKLETHYPSQVVDFVSAYIASLEDEERVEAEGRCLIIRAAEAWDSVAARVKEKHILIADASLDLGSEQGTRLIQRARRANHAVIYGGPRGGIPDRATALLPPPRSHEIQHALEKAGYSEERARALARRSGANLGSLLRCLQNLSLMPEWAQGSAASELATAAALGSWCDGSDSDRAAVESVLGKHYGEWAGTIREISLRPDTPLTQKDGSWRFTARFEAWYALGPRLFDDQLDRIGTVAALVLREKDPGLSLPPDERYASSVLGLVPRHSGLLRRGLADCLALLGSHPRALASCTLGKAEATARLAVRQILGAADWQLWASANDVLPLLAEAAPTEFLHAVESALSSHESPFEAILGQEGHSLLGANYATGLLWALETLAWDADLLCRVVLCLGELAARDPGGRWANRPASSLRTILLPWMPQTCAPIDRRSLALRTLLTEAPDVGWKPLLSLLPEHSSTSSGSRRPAWRETIPDDWSSQGTPQDFWEQSVLYSEIATEAAGHDPQRLAELVEHLENLLPPAQDRLLAHLGSSAVAGMGEAERLPVWNALRDIVARHRRTPDARWAMGSEKCAALEALAARLAPDAPALRHLRLFGHESFDLEVAGGRLRESSERLERRREEAIVEIGAHGGAKAVLDFAAAVELPSSVGVAYGVVAASGADADVVPELLRSPSHPLTQFAGGFVWSRFRSLGWDWVDGMDVSSWTPSQIGLLLSFLPFTHHTWDRASRLLGKDEAPYWSASNPNPWEDEEGLEIAIDRLVANGRPHAAMACLAKLIHDKKPVDCRRTIRALLAALTSSEPLRSLDPYDIVELIKALQADPSVPPDQLATVEWPYLPLLDGHRGASPKSLERRLADDPGFFCEAIRKVFRSTADSGPKAKLSEPEQTVATNAYHLLRQWRTPPGLREDGTYDGGALASWLKTVRAECSATGHLEIAMTMLGHSLTHVPADPDGLWIHHAAAKALDAGDADDMRGGYRTELFNSRGVHWADPSGKPERGLADRYRMQADAVEKAGYFRLCASLRELAESYDLDAETVRSESLFGE